MRTGATWTDACILNLSTRGMLLRSPANPRRGSYLELRRGPHVIVARVIWSRSDHFGVQTQDPLCPDRLMLDSQAPAMAAHPQGSARAERRSSPRPASEKLDASRRRGRAIEFGALLLLCLLGSLFIGEGVATALSEPLRAVNAAFVAN